MKRVKTVCILLICYLFWGMQPIYWSFLDGFSSMFMLCTRILMSVFFTWLYLIVAGRFGEIMQAFRNRALMKRLIPAAVFLCCDWAFFIWAVTDGRVLDTALGYYLNPLAIFLAGVFVFREKGHILEYIAVGVACTGVVISVIQYGSFPVTALIFAVFWPAYSCVTKAANTDPFVGIAVESAMMAPFALAYALIFCRGQGGFADVTWSAAPALIGSGLVTALPMVLYAYVVNDLPFKVIGILQYLSTTITFFCGILFMNEAMTSSKLVMFVFIWLGLVIFTVGGFRRQRLSRIHTLPEKPTE